MVGESRLIAETRGLAGLISDDTSLIVLRLLGFATFPVIVATYMVRRTGQTLNRHTLEEPFYSQCYATAPFAMAFSIAATVSQLDGLWADGVGAALVVVATISWLAIQTLWFERRLGIARLRGLGHALVAYAQCLAILSVLAWLTGGYGI